MSADLTLQHSYLISCSFAATEDIMSSGCSSFLFSKVVTWLILSNKKSDSDLKFHKHTTSGILHGLTIQTWLQGLTLRVNADCHKGESREKLNNYLPRIVFIPSHAYTQRAVSNMNWERDGGSLPP